MNIQDAVELLALEIVSIPRFGSEGSDPSDASDPSES